MLLSFFLFSEI